MLIYFNFLLISVVTILLNLVNKIFLFLPDPNQSINFHNRMQWWSLMGGVWTEDVGFIKICESIPVFDHEVPVWQIVGEKITQNPESI